MGKMSELSIIINELRNTAISLHAVAESLQALMAEQEEHSKSSTATPMNTQKPLTLEAVRAVLAKKSMDGYTAEIRVLLEKHGAVKLSDVKPAEYPELLAEAETLGNG